MYKIIFLLLFSFLHFHAQPMSICRYAFLNLPKDNIKQLLSAENLLNKSLSDLQIQAVIEAHNIGIGEAGRNGAPAGIGNYTYIQLLQKTRILRQSGFTRSEVRTLMENKIVGTEMDGNNSLNDEPVGLSIPDRVMAEMGLKRLNRGFSEIPTKELLNMGEETKRKIDKIVSQMSPEEIAAILLYYEFRSDLKDDNRSRNNHISWEIISSTVSYNHLFLDTDRRPVSKKVFFALLPYPFLSDKQVEAIPLEMIENIPPNMMKYINSFTAYFMTIEQVKTLSPEQISKIPPEHMKRFFTSEKIGEMTMEQINAITSEQRTGIPLELADAIRAKIYGEISARHNTN